MNGATRQPRPHSAAARPPRGQHRGRDTLRRPREDRPAQQIAYENTAKALQEPVAQQTVLVDQLKAGLNGMRAKLEELKTKRDELAARAKMAEAQRQVQESVASIDSLDPTSDLGRFEDKVRQDEAMAKGMAEVSASSLDAQFEDLDNASRDAEVETRLASLKGGSSPS